MYKFLIPLFALALLCSCTPANDTNTAADNDDGSSIKVTVSDPTPPTVTDTPTPETDIDLLSGTHTVTLKTTKGDIMLELDADAAPLTVTNFVTLAREGYYDDLTFHRVIPDFMIQGGDPNGNGTGGRSIYGDTFQDEANSITLDKGVIAMANRGPNTNGSQFFIIQAEGGTPWLQGRHTAFGKVTSGLEVVDDIANTDTGPGDLPLEPISYTVEVQ